MIVNEQTWKYVREHAEGDIRKLALQGSKDTAVDMPMALQQIAGRQMARRKLPVWAATEGIVYPPHLNMEQCSSEQTARYKAALVGEGRRYVDLTGGFGVDFYWMSQRFQERCYVERDALLCAISAENFQTLDLPCSVCCSTTEDYLATLDPADVVYLDPARRNDHGGRTYDIRDCTPNILELLPLLQEKARKVILKLSPMLDWRKAVDDLQHLSRNTPPSTLLSQPSSFLVTEVHILSVGNECKELLLVLEQTPRPFRLVCVNDDQVFEVGEHSSLQTPPSTFLPPSSSLRTPHLFEPNASIMKAGCFAALTARYPVRQVAPNSHLFLSDEDVADFPGRRFQIEAVSSLNKRDLAAALSGIEAANITVRNFPMSVDQLRKKLKLKDGGDHYIFATTGADNTHQLFICRKIG